MKFSSKINFVAPACRPAGNVALRRSVFEGVIIQNFKFKIPNCLGNASFPLYALFLYSAFCDGT